MGRSCPRRACPARSGRAARGGCRRGNLTHSCASVRPPVRRCAGWPCRRHPCDRAGWNVCRRNVGRARVHRHRDCRARPLVAAWRRRGSVALRRRQPVAVCVSVPRMAGSVSALPSPAVRTHLARAGRNSAACRGPSGAGDRARGRFGLGRLVRGVRVLTSRRQEGPAKIKMPGVTPYSSEWILERLELQPVDRKPDL